MRITNSPWLLPSIAAIAISTYTDVLPASTNIHYGTPVDMGDGTIRSYVALDSADAPIEFGLLMSRDSLDGLPAERSTTGRCFDMNGNGQIDGTTECEGDHEYVVTVPSQVGDRSDFPFQWIGANWNLGGHPPPGVYDLPHFDFHFYTVSEASVRALSAGRCGFFMDCTHFERAIKPVPARYVHPHHINVDAAVMAMGNHLIDSKSHEFANPPKKFDYTWIFGAYDGQITFYEPMITNEFFASRPNTCVPIKQPQAWRTAGHYPTRYCIRYHDRAKKYTVSLEGFEYRKAE